VSAEVLLITLTFVCRVLSRLQTQSQFMMVTCFSVGLLQDAKEEEQNDEDESEEEEESEDESLVYLIISPISCNFACNSISVAVVYGGVLVLVRS
jgi:hypothetical protein